MYRNMDVKLMQPAIMISKISPYLDYMIGKKKLGIVTMKNPINIS